MRLLIFFFSLSLTASANRLAAGFHQSCYLTPQGEFYCWGYGGNGQLGTGNFQPQLTPVKGEGDSITAVAAGWDSTCFLNKRGEVKCLGSNLQGQLGLGLKEAYVGTKSTETLRILPPIRLADAPVEVTAIAVGESHACALLKGGQIKCWGNNSEGQLGHKKKARVGLDPNDMGEKLESIPLEGATAEKICAGRRHTCALLGDGEIKCWGTITPAGVSREESATAIACGDRFGCLLNKKGEVKCWGTPTNGVLGPNTKNQASPFVVPISSQLEVVDLSCGYSHCCARLENNTLKCWGNNDNAQLGLEDLENRGNKAEEMGDALAYVNLGKLSSVEAIGTGAAHTCALLEGEKVKCWGGNYSGQLGNGTQYNLLGNKLGQMGDNLRPLTFTEPRVTQQ